MLTLFVSVGFAKLGNPTDSSTYANIDEVRTEHLDLDFKVDFQTEKFVGTATHIMEIVGDQGVNQVVFDVVGIDVQKVEQKIRSTRSIDLQWEERSFSTNNDHPLLGSALIIDLPFRRLKGEFIEIKLTYNTNKNGTAINWLKPSQTAGKVLPYLFTQCEDIACRSVAPLQDTPANKLTYSAKVTVDEKFKVRMSANHTGMVHDTENKMISYYFQNTIHMASYLIAIAVGDLEERSLGRRVSVITEPSQLDRVANELDTLEELLDKTEAYLTPYIWGNYSILVLPPSFPMGGMENPLLTFASPTIITGDKSQVYVATHEIAHSWTGNDLTCENWSNLWLNEGFTVFEERKISGQIHGKDFPMVDAFLGNISAWEAMQDKGLTNTYASLYPVVNDDLPDNSFTEIPYEKGFQFLYFIETLIGENNMQ